VPAPGPEELACGSAVRARHLDPSLTSSGCSGRRAGPIEEPACRAAEERGHRVAVERELAGFCERTAYREPWLVAAPKDPTAIRRACHEPNELRVAVLGA
jgi:hypothetical protein